MTDHIIAEVRSQKSEVKFTARTTFERRENFLTCWRLLYFRFSSVTENLDFCIFLALVIDNDDLFFGLVLYRKN
ncbi:MAG: hypothetical protein F6K40_18115 [Okeania sp. SIO3I5]|uniref:hypothetical protein n=1 Tax=Okeania sp. SIO3I5 TaxID=2607805 RepID=UPI0013BC021A|nr:hypothetical protein [Okeania sp. SIO3I5]NEQ38073.1 hypothetical protein [Okeania sp. SIO3I5]